MAFGTANRALILLCLPCLLVIRFQVLLLHFGLILLSLPRWLFFLTPAISVRRIPPLHYRRDMGPKCKSPRPLHRASTCTSNSSKTSPFGCPTGSSNLACLKLNIFSLIPWKSPLYPVCCIISHPSHKLEHHLYLPSFPLYIF